VLEKSKKAVIKFLIIRLIISLANVFVMSFLSLFNYTG